MNSMALSFGLGVMFGAYFIYRLAKLDLRFLPLISFIQWLKAGCKPTEIFFFPDRQMPCNSYFDKTRCWKRNGECTHLHRRDNSSLMKVMSTLEGANQVDLCMYRFTLQKVADALIDLHKQGAKIRIITDTPNTTIESNQIPRLRSRGIRVREKSSAPKDDDRYPPLMHNKFVIVDRKCCLLGSFNWTFNAVTKNSETIIRSYEPSVVAPLVKKFEELWQRLPDSRD